MTKATRFGDLTLTRFERRGLAGTEVGGCHMQFELRNQRKPVTQMLFSCDSITDRSGQAFGNIPNGKYWDNRGPNDYRFPTAPWSDDPVWRFKVKLWHRDYCPDVDESEIFHFDHLPVPQGARTEVNRSMCRNGITLHIGAIERSKNGHWLFCIEGCPSAKGGGNYLLLQDARDDQGRTTVETVTSNLTLVERLRHLLGRTTVATVHSIDPIIRGPFREQPEGPVYSLDLPPDARWWDLKVVPETVETVDFEARPTFIK